MKYYTFFILIFCLSCTSNEQTQIVGKDSTRIVFVDQDDKDMEAVITNAQLSLPQFDSALFSGNQNYNFFSLKVRFPYGENNGEHIWLIDISKTKEQYTGIINNVPEFVADLRKGDTIKINKKDISDWMYLENNALRGGFTIRLFRNRMSQSEREKFDSTNFYKIED